MKNSVTIFKIVLKTNKKKKNKLLYFIIFICEILIHIMHSNWSTKYYYKFTVEVDRHYTLQWYSLQRELFSNVSTN